MARRATLSRQSVEDEGPSFFKVILNRSIMQPVRIPPKFHHHMLGDETQIATLTLNNCSERIWHVNVSRRGTQIYLEDGWQDFVTNNSLRDKEFVVFQYVKEMRFMVTIFDKNGLSRDPPAYCQCNTEIPLSLGRPPRGGRLGSPAAVAVEAFNSDFPYFSKVIGKSMKLSIPTDFYQKQFAGKYGKGDEVVLVTSEGNFAVTLCPVAETMAMSGGWSAFRDANRIWVDDVLVCELVEENTMEVHIFRN